MAKLTVILVDEGVKLRDYSVAGDLEVLSKAFKEAVIKSFDSCIKSIQPTMSIPKENDAEHEVLATQESSEVKADSSYILQPGRGSLVGLKCPDRKSTRLNSSHANISYAVFCLKKKKIK